MVQIGSGIRALASRRSYLSALFLVTRWIPGIVYVLLLSLGLIGASTSILLVGIPLLIGCLALLWSCAAFERDLAAWWLGVDLPPMRPPPRDGAGPSKGWQRLREHLGLSVTWKSMAYLALQLPMGLVALLLVVVPIAFALALILAPFFYLADVLISGGGPGDFASPLLWLTGGSARLDVRGLLVTAILCVLGCAALTAVLSLMNRAANWWGTLARSLLSASDAELEVAEARRVAVDEHRRAERADRSRQELIVNLSHELRTPIASIRGHVEALRVTDRARPDPSTAERYLDVIARESDRLSALVEDLMSLARAESDELRLEIRPLSVEEVVGHTERSVTAIAQRERQVKVVTILPPEPLPEVLADHDRLLQVLLNLVRNAVAYTPEGGMVSIQASRLDAGWVAVQVADTGVGIEPADLEHVFDRFYRADASRSRKTGGFGLGLSIAKDLVDAMGGAITAESRPGRGSRFQVALRVAR